MTTTKTPVFSLEMLENARKIAEKVTDDYFNYNINPREAAFVAQAFSDLYDTLKSVITEDSTNVHG